MPKEKPLSDKGFYARAELAVLQTARDILAF
jgi:hypothetical protein